jgi:hypothetical protein
MQLDLTAEEAAVLADGLDSALGNVREEIYKSEVAEYKAALKLREAILVGLIARLAARPAP